MVRYQKYYGLYKALYGHLCTKIEMKRDHKRLYWQFRQKPKKPEINRQTEKSKGGLDMGVRDMRPGNKC